MADKETASAAPKKGAFSIKTQEETSMKNISFQVKPELYDEFIATQEASGANKSDFLRQALRFALDNV